MQKLLLKVVIVMSEIRPVFGLWNHFAEISRTVHES